MENSPERLKKIREMVRVVQRGCPLGIWNHIPKYSYSIPSWALKMAFVSPNCLMGLTKWFFET